MNAWRRHRPPRDAVSDTYISLSERTQNKQWHPDHGPPRYRAEYSEDAHMMMKCLWLNLPLSTITAPTKLSFSEDEFARRFGVKFADLAKKQNGGQTQILSKHATLGFRKRFAKSRTTKQIHF